MGYRNGTIPVIVAVILAFSLAGCLPGTTVTRSSPVDGRAVENVAVLLFENRAEGTRPHLAEIATDAFTLELVRYFPSLVDRYDVGEEMRARGMNRAPRTAAEMRALGEALGVDGLFVGAITGFSEKRTFLGWNGKPYIRIECRLFSTRTGETILTGRAGVTESYLLPLENTREMAVFGVREMTDRMRLAEQFGPPVLTRDEPLWRKAMNNYEARRFWAAAEGFGELVRLFARCDLRDEARLYLGRSLEELGIDEAAGEVYRGFQEGPFLSRALYRLAETERKRGNVDEAVRLAAVVAAREPASSETEGVRYTAGVALAGAGRTAESVEMLERVRRGGRWWRFARYALADSYRSAGRTGDARRALEEAALPGGATESERRLAERAAFALGDLHYGDGRMDEARRWYERAGGSERPRSAIALAWIAASEGDFESAIVLLTGPEVHDDPRWSCEAHLLAGSCRVRRGEWYEAAASFTAALEDCDRWDEDEERAGSLRAERSAARREWVEGIVPYEREIARLMTEERTKEEETLFRSLRNLQKGITLQIARIDRSIPVPVGGGAWVRSEIREKAEFSLAQVLYQNGVRERSGRELLLGSRDGE